MTPSKNSKLVLAVVVICFALGVLASGCATPEGGSDMPWNRPDNSEFQTMGIQY